jgi:hypothetical protein
MPALLALPTHSGKVFLLPNLYLPAPGRPLYGVARAIVKDSGDSGAPVFVDSDGAVGENMRRYVQHERPLLGPSVPSFHAVISVGRTLLLPPLPCKFASGRIT